MLIKINDIDEDIHQLIGTIYDTCLDTSLWRDVQKNVCSMTGGVGSHILLFDRNRKPIETLIHSSMDTRAASMMEEDYFHWYHQFDDYRIASAIRNGSNVVVTNDELTPDNKKNNCPLYNEYFRYYDAEEQLIYGSEISTNNAIAIVHARPRSAGAHSEEERRLFLRLSNHIKKAMAMRLNIQGISGIKNDILDIVCCNQKAVVVVDRNRSILWANECASGSLLAGSSIRQVNGALSIENREENNRVKRLVDQALDLSKKGKNRCDFTTVTNGMTRLVLSVFSSSVEFAMFSDSKPVAILVFVDPSSVAPPSLELIQTYFHLTPAESCLTLALANGLCLQDYANKREITISTARSTLRDVMYKTGCKRQSELVRLAILLKA